VLILLPPSEGKTAPESGAKYSPAKLGYPGLKKVRGEVLRALLDLCSGNVDRAATVLGLGPKQRDLVAVNAQVTKAHAAPAIDIYTGVLYEALDFASLPSTARKRADSTVAIASALFGLLRPSDRIPAYRLSGDTTLPGIGPLSSVWKESVTAELASAVKTSGPIIDLRSGAYVALGPIPPEVVDRALIGRVLLERGGKRSVVSHHNKATKGRLTREVLKHGKTPRTVEKVPAYLSELGFHSEIREPKRDGDPLGLDIIVYET